MKTKQKEFSKIIQDLTGKIKRDLNKIKKHLTCC